MGGLPAAIVKDILLWHSQGVGYRNPVVPKIVEPEIQVPTVWRLGFAIPLSFFTKYTAIDPKLSGQVWHANFTKCADQTSHPHWLSWMPLSRLDFHLPDEFGELVFE